MHLKGNRAHLRVHNVKKIKVSSLYKLTYKSGPDTSLSAESQSIIVEVSLLRTLYWTDSEEILSMYTDKLADALEKTYAYFFKGAKIDRPQLFGELYFHYYCLKNDIMASDAASADINIYMDGSVRDHRPFVNQMASAYKNKYKS